MENNLCIKPEKIKKRNNITDLVFKVDANGTSTKLFHKNVFIGEITYMTMPISSRHFMVEFADKIILCLTSDIAKQHLVNEYFLNILEKENK